MHRLVAGRGLVPVRLPLLTQGRDVFVRGGARLVPAQDGGQATGQHVFAGGVGVRLDVLVAEGGTRTEVDTRLDEVAILSRGDRVDAVVLGGGCVQSDGVFVDQDEGTREKIAE